MMNENKKKKVTIYDVAKAADVSPGTVSRYINGVGVPRDKARERIEKAIEDLEYVPNRAARALKSKKNNLLCLTYPESDNPFFFSLVDTIEKEAKKYGYSLMIYHTHGKPEDIAIIGLDNIDFDQALTPQLSSIKMSRRKLENVHLIS